MGGKPTKAQRAKLLHPTMRDMICASNDDLLLAIHDLCHEEMERRHGTNKRGEVETKARRP